MMRNDTNRGKEQEPEGKTGGDSLSEKDLIECVLVGEG